MKTKIALVFLTLILILIMTPQVLACPVQIKIVCVTGTDTVPTPTSPPEKTWVSSDGSVTITYNQMKAGSTFTLQGTNGFSISGTGADVPTIYHKLDLNAGTSLELFYKIWTIPTRGTFEGFGTVFYWGMINGQYFTGKNQGYMTLRGTGEFTGKTLYLTFTVHSDLTVTITGTMTTT